MHAARRLLYLAFLLLLLLLAGCSSSAMRFESEGGSYDIDTVTSAAPDDATILGKPVSEAAGLRHDALVALRSDSEDGAVLADLLTEQFPDNDRSVPFYAESASFNGAAAWVVFEVWGSQGGTLEHTRVWVFDRESERVLLTAAAD